MASSKRKARRIIRGSESQPEFEGFTGQRRKAAGKGSGALRKLSEFDAGLLETFRKRKTRGRNFATILGVRRFPAGELRLRRQTLLGGGGTLGV